MASAIFPFYEDAIRETGVLDILAPFDPHVVGTLPLGIALPRSDIDIVCHAPDRNAIAQVIWAKFRSADGFALYQWSARGRPLVARFEALGWPFEIFAATEPVEDQAGWRHFRVEQRLLNLAGVALQNQIMAIRTRGLKTEPAFAAVLGLPGDPYDALCSLFGMSDMELAALLAAATDQ